MSPRKVNFVKVSYHIQIKIRSQNTQLHLNFKFIVDSNYILSQIHNSTSLIISYAKSKVDFGKLVFKIPEFTIFLNFFASRHL